MSAKVTGASLKPDSKYQSLNVSKFINCMMWDGKKSVAEAVFYGAMEIIASKVKDEEPIKVFEKAMENVKPMVEVRSRRVGGANYQVPVPVKPKRQVSLATRWILLSARGKKGKPMKERLATEFMEAYKREGGAMMTRENVHRMAEANKAFAHFAW